jgi:uncharacterized membrane protein YeaQ/YmgE (transglycosylase-associated protein family)
MSPIGFLVLLLIATITGAIGQAIAGFSRGGCLAAIALGFVGAYIGQWIATYFHLPTFLVINIDGQPFPVVWAIIGAALVAAVLSLFFGYRRTRRVRRRS